MEKQTKIGRPPKAEGTAKRAHFSVWVTQEQKTRINEMIGKSGLSASEYFLTLALDVPFKRPQKRTLPPQTAKTIRVLEQLAGILSLAVVKTKDRQMLSREWQESSQRIRLLANLTTRWAFESFEIHSFQNTITQVHAWINQTNRYLKEMLEQGESMELMLESGSRMAKQLQALLDKYDAYYSEALEEIREAEKTNPETPDRIHEVIADTLKAVTAENDNLKQNDR